MPEKYYEPYGQGGFWHRSSQKKRRKMQRHLGKRTWTVMPECVWLQEGICVNEDCPMFCGCCPVEDEQGMCGYEEREEGEQDG